MSLAETKNEPRREIEIIELLDRQRATAIVLAGTRLGDADDDAALLAALEGYRRRGGRVALIGQRLGELPVLRVDDAGAAAALATQVVNLGYRSFAIAAGPQHHRTAAERTRALRGQLARLGHRMPGSHVVNSDLTRAGGRLAARALLSLPQHPEVIMAATDLMAVGVLSAIRELGLAVPGDLAVTGFDDIEVASDVTPALTTVHLPLSLIGERATALALAANAASSLQPVLGDVVVRGSTPGR